MDTLPEDIILHIATFIKYPIEPDPIISLFSINKRFRRIFRDNRDIILRDIASRCDYTILRINETNSHIVNLANYSKTINELFDYMQIALPLQSPHRSMLEHYRARYLYCRINLLRYNVIINKHEVMTLMILFHDRLYEVIGSNEITNDTWKFNYNLLSMYYHAHKYSEKELDVLKFIVNKYAYTKKELINIMNILLIHGRISSMDFMNKYIL